MKITGGERLGVLVLIVLILFILGFVGWIKNLISLSDCDFASPYKCEVVHIVGVVPIIGAITGWMDVGK